MINEGYDHVIATADKKMKFYINCKTSYFMSSILAGLFVGICIVTSLIMAGMLNDFAGLKIIQGASFAAALSLVVFAGAELFTGNVFVMTAGYMKKKIRLPDAMQFLTHCYLGNLLGSIIIAGLFGGTGYLQDKVLIETVYAIYSKTNPTFVQLFIRGVLCNILVCAAVWCMYRMKSESAKLIMIFWCIYMFVVCGFEHSIANMTLFSLGLMASADDMASFGLIVMNLTATTLGNILGGIMLSLSYWAVARKTVE